MLSAQTEFLISLFLLVTFAIVAGELALRVGQLALVGQLLVGVLLGPTLLGPFIGLSTVSPYLSAVQWIATFFLLFLAGLEMGPRQIYGMKRGTFALGVALFFVPFVLTLFTALEVAHGLSFTTAAFLAVTLSITALPVMAVMVKEFGLVGNELGNTVMAAALVNELCAVTVFAVLLQISDNGAKFGWTSLAIALGSTAIFVAAMSAVYYFLKYARTDSGWIGASHRFAATVRIQEAGFALLMILSLGAALLSQFLGLTFVIGAFYAGILVTPESVGAKLYASVRSAVGVIMWGLFLPLFFAITGLQVDLRLLLTASSLVAFGALLVAAMFSKVGVGAIFGRARRWSAPDAVALGFMANCRGAVEIAMAVILYADGLLSTFWFTVAVGVGLVCTVIAPIGALAAWRSTSASRQELRERAPALAGGVPSLSPTE